MRIQIFDRSQLQAIVLKIQRKLKTVNKIELTFISFPLYFKNSSFKSKTTFFNFYFLSKYFLSKLLLNTKVNIKKILQLL